MELRPYQHTAVDRCREAIAQGARRILLVAPTGSGKTVIASHMINLTRQKYNDSMFVAHRREIIHQTSNKLDRFSCPHGVIMSSSQRTSGSARVQLASIQTYLARCAGEGRWKPRPKVIYIDEAHRSLAPSYTTMLNDHPDVVVIGLTATPCRGDGKGLGALYDVMIEVTSVAELIDLGFLIEPDVYAPTIPDLQNAKVRRGDYAREDIEAIMDLQILVGNTVDDWRERAAGRQTIVFASGVAHSMHLNEEFRKHGIKSIHIDGSTDSEERDEMLADFERGAHQVVCNADVLLEGYDNPNLSCAVLARPTKSYGLYLQMVGRIMRIDEEGFKKDAVLLDHAGAVYEHGFVRDAGGWSLDPDTPIQRVRAEARKKDREPTTCRECFHVYDHGKSCPRCGWTPTKQAMAVNFAEGRLKPVVRVKRQQSEEQKFWNNCLFRCIKTGKMVGVAGHMYRKKYNVFPRNLKMCPEGKEWKLKAEDFYEHWKRCNPRGDDGGDKSIT